MKIKTAEAKGLHLDWAAANALGHIWEGDSGERPNSCRFQLRASGLILDTKSVTNDFFQPSIDGRQTMELIQNGKLIIAPNPSGGWVARSFGDATEHHGNTPMIAATRCFVVDTFGEEVDLPDHLAQKEMVQA